MNGTPCRGTEKDPTAAVFQKQILNFIEQILEYRILLMFYVEILTQKFISTKLKNY